MSYNGKKATEIDTGYVHGRNAGRITVHERGFGKWEVVYHPVRGNEVSLGVFTTKTEAVNFGWQTYSARNGVPLAADSGS